MNDLDHRVATEVMGWTLHDCMANYHDCHCEKPGRYWLEGGVFKLFVHQFRPSTDWRDAMAVVGVIKGRFFSQRKSFIETLREQTGEARIDPDWLLFRMTPEGVCQAALDVMASDQEGP